MIRQKLPHEVKSEETKQKILTTTEKMLSQYDFKYLTVRNLCEEAGVAYGSFYHHFTSKENLLFIYTGNLYQVARRENPIPDWVNPGDYIECILWHTLVYGKFCEMMGKDLTRYLYQNCPQDLFAETYDQEVIPTINDAKQRGMLDPRREKPYNRPPEVLLAKDIEIVEKGTVVWWSFYSKADAEPLHETLEHLIFNMLYSYCSEQYRATDHLRMLLTEREQFPGSITIRPIGGAQEN